MSEISVILSASPYEGWSTRVSEPFHQRALALNEEFVNYVLQDKIDMLHLAILTYMGMDLHIPELRVKKVEKGSKFLITIDDDGLEQIIIIDEDAIMMTAKKFNPDEQD